MTQAPQSPSDPARGVKDDVDTFRDIAGEPACMAHLVCPSCGGVVTEGHQPGCELDD